MFWPLLSILLIIFALLITGFITTVLIVPIFGPLSWVFYLIILFIVGNFLKKQIINPNDPLHWGGDKNKTVNSDFLNDEEEKHENNHYSKEKKINKSLQKTSNKMTKEKKTPNINNSSTSNYQAIKNKIENVDFIPELEKLNFVFLESKNDSLSLVFNNIMEGSLDPQHNKEWEEIYDDIKDGKCVVINKFFKINMVTYDSLPFYHVFARGNNLAKIYGLKKTYSTDFAFENLSKAFAHLIKEERKELFKKSFLEKEKIFVFDRSTDLEIYSKASVERKIIDDKKIIEDEKKVLQQQNAEDDKLLRKKLSEVKKLYDDGLITEEVLKKKQEKIMGLKD